eukprot:13167872-Alexandrium_andersonii.AAC.1
MHEELIVEHNIQKLERRTGWRGSGQSVHSPSENDGSRSAPWLLCDRRTVATVRRRRAPVSCFARSPDRVIRSLRPVRRAL